MSPSKGKAKKQHWQCDWWDFQMLAERTQRPLVWSQSSVIFTAHSTQPLVSARHLSSSRQFLLPSPAPVIASPASYAPPAVISVDPREEWLFAYFPGNATVGTACLWNRGFQIDEWNIKEWWAVARGAGVIAASWLGAPREWITDMSTAVSTCLPRRGPPTPVSDITLLLVTQDHMVNLYYYRHYVSALQIIRCPLDKSASATDFRNYVGNSANPSKQCFRAAIGLNYNETSILVATRSYASPALELQLDSTFSSDSDPQSNLVFPDTQTHEEDTIINITEVHLKFNGAAMGMISEPLPPILDIASPLTSLNFVTTPPPSSLGPDPASSSRIVDEKGPFYLVSTFLDFGDFTSTPKSAVVTHMISRQPLPTSGANKYLWMHRQLASRAFAPQVGIFAVPCPAISAHGSPLVYVGIVDVSGPMSGSSSSMKEICSGEIRLLKIIDFLDENSDPTSIMSTVDSVGRDIPYHAVASPNRVLISTLSSSIYPVRTAIHLLPRLRCTSAPSGESTIPHLSARLSAAILSRRSAGDITHILSLLDIPMSEVVSILYFAIKALDVHQPGLSEDLFFSVIREAMAVYRKRCYNLPKIHTDRDDLEARWKTAHDICSVFACNQAFEDSQEGETYDLDAAWQIIALCTWAVTLTERVMKECVLFSSFFEADKTTSSQLLSSPVFLHLSCPFALEKFSAMVTHVKQFRTYLGALSAKGQNAQIAREILIDAVDGSGIDFATLESLLITSLPECRTLDKDDCLKALATCQPTAGMQLYLSKLIKNLASLRILHKSTLFIKPQDLVDDMESLSLSLKRTRDRDVISKQILAGQVASATCQRCGGHSEVGREFGEEYVSPRWTAWEKMWKSRCICGGSWMKTDIV